MVKNELPCLAADREWLQPVMATFIGALKDDRRKR